MKRSKKGKGSILFLLAALLLLCLGGCQKDADTEAVEAARSSREDEAARTLREQLKDPEVEEIVLSEDVTVMGCLTVNGSKTISGEGTILLAKAAVRGVYQDASIWEDEQAVTEEDLEQMPESSVFYVGDGAKLTLEGAVAIDSSQVGNGIVVGEGGIVTIGENISLTGGNFCNLYNAGTAVLNGGSFGGAGGYNLINAGSLTLSGGTLDGEQSRGNLYNSGELTMTGGKLQNAGAYNVYVAEEGTASLSGGELAGAGTANVAIAKAGKAEVTGAAALRSGAVGILNYGTLDVSGAAIEMNMTNIRNYGTASVRETEILQSTVNNIENQETGSLTFSDSHITGSGAIGIYNQKGNITFDTLSVRRSGGSAVYNSGGELSGRDLVIYGSAGTAIDNIDSPDGTKGNVDIDTLEIQTGTGMNVVQESCGEMTLKNAVLGTTSITNVKLISGTLDIDGMELLGTTSTGAGIWTIGGKLKLTNSTIAETKGRGLALAGGEITGENITFRDVVNTGVDGMLHDNGYTSATAVLKDLAFSGGQRDNVAVTAANADLTIEGGSFGKTLGNNVRATKGKVTLNSVEILGNQYVSGGNTNYHGVYLSGGEVTLKDCVIQDPLACAIRNKGGKLTAENLTTKNTPAAAITNAWNDNKTDYGDISIDGLTTVNAELGAVRNDCPGTVTVRNGSFGESPANQAMVTDGSMYLTDVAVERSIKSGEDNYHSVYVTGGYLELASVELKDSDSSGIRQTGGVITGNNVTVTNAKVNGVNVSGGRTTLTDSVLNATLRTNVNVTAEGASVVLNNVQVKGAGDAAGNNVNCIYIAPGAEVTLRNGTRVSGSVTRAGILSEGGRLYIDGAEIFENATRGINLANKSVKDEATGAVTLYVPYSEIRNADIHDNGNNTVTGGAIYNEGELTLADSTLQGNAATSGGAINLGNTSRTSLRNVSVIGNTSTGNGGGIHVSSGSYLTIAGGNIASNQAGGNGDAIRVNSADFYLTENAVVDSDNDIYLERSCTVKTIGTGIGNTEKNPLRITLADTNYGTVVVENDSTGEAARIGSNVVCLDKEGNVLESTAFDTFLVLGKQEEIDYVARIADGNGSYRYFTSLNAAINAAATDGSQTRIEVLADITLKASVDIPQDGNRNILLTDDGNGPYTITRAFTGGRMIILRTGNRLTLAGSSGSDRNPSLILDGGGLEAEKDQQIICVGTTATNKNAALTLNAGVKLANNNNSNGGGAVIVYGSLTMNGGVIEGNASANDHGGAVYVMATGEMAMNGGTIRDNKSKLDGGAVMVNGSGRLTMTGGTITGNEARSGGAIILNYASSACGAMTMSGGTIRDNTATNNGGAIFVHARGALTMSGGTISGNEGGNGGAVYLHYNASNGVGVMTMSGGTISGNTASGNGGGVGMANASNTLTMTGGTVRSNTSGGSGADVYAVGALTMESAADVGSLYLTDDNRITLSGPLSDRSTVTEVVLGAYPEGRKVLDGDAAAVASGHAFFETPEGSGVDIDAAGCLVSNGESADYEARIVNPDGSWTGYMTLQAAIDAAVTDGSQTRIEVMKDITLTAALDIPENGNRNILLTDDGNGPYTITRDFTGGTMIILRTGNEMMLGGSSGDDGSPSLILDGAGLAATSDQGIIKVGTNTSKNYHATLTVNAGVKLTNNKSGSNGSAIRVYGNLNMNGGVLEGNETTGTGGAVSVELTGTMTMTGGTISSNKSAKEGGGIVVYGSGELTIEDGTITGNRGTAGGAICTLFSSGAGGTVTVSGGTISDNTGSGNGGAIFIHAKGLLTVTGGTITGNQGNHGGAIYLHYNATNGTGTLVMSGGTITDNTAKGNGGGVGMANAANTMTMTGGTISGNTAGGTGDGIHAAGTLNMAGAAYADEIYLPAGKAVNLTAALSQREEAMTLVLPGDSYTPGRKVLDGEEAVIAGSYAYFQVPEESGTAIDSTGCLTATGEDVDYEARIVNPDGSWTDYMTLAEAVSAAATDGSQTRIEVMKDLTLTAALDIPQDGNRNILLTDDGNGPYTITRGFTGGRMIILRTGNQMTLAGSSGNDDEPSLIFDGAGLAASSNQQIICVGTSTTRKDATLTLNAGVKLNNNQNANGGGAVIVYGSLTMNGGVIEGNASTGDNSGAVHVMATGEMTMNGGAIRDNTANKNGGAIYVLGKLTLTDGTISGNQCSGDGGAIYVNNGASMVMEGGTISGNTSASEGGGILVNGTGTLTIEDGTITGNETTGAAGGAICTLFSEGAGGTVTIHGGTITENKASGNGGAIFIHARGLLTVTGGTITGNQGNHGGAIYLHYNATNGTGTLNMSGGTVTGNTAKGNGGGVGMANAANTMTMSGGTISGNTAGGTGDGIHAAGTLNMAGTAYADEIYLPAGKAVNLTEVLSSRENLIKIVMPVYEDGTHVLTGDALVLAESYGNFTPENAGYIINDEGVLEVNASIVDTTWHLGYVGSNTNVNHANQIVIGTSGNYYSYSDVITIEKAGTKIWFTDDNTNANGDSLYASTAAYVISSWKQEDNDWVIDLESANYCGSTSNTSEIASYDNGAVTYTYVTSEDNEHIRLCFRSGEKADFTPEIYPTIYMQMTEEYGTFAHIKWANESKKNSYFETLEGKTIYAIGDSYFAGNGLDKRFVWPELLSVKYNCMFNNYGINGNALSSYNNASNPMVTRYTTMAVAEPDIIFVEGGKNDYNRNTPLGTVDSMDTDTFMGALNVLLCGLHDRYPNAQIMCFTVWNVNQTNSLGLTVNDYGKAMQAVCKERNVPCFDAMDIKATGVNMNDATFRAQYCMLPNDVSHLNVEGMKLVFPVVESFVAQAYEERLEFNRIEVSPENAVAKIGNIYYETLQAAVNAVPTTGVETKIEITKSISLDKPLDVPESGNRNFILTDDGNGPYTITRNFSGDRMIILRKGNIMTLQGTGTDEKPTLIIDGNGENVAAGVNGQAIAVGTSNVNYDATMNIKTGVKIHNNACNSNGGGIAVFGTVNMEGGVITDNRTTGTGGGIIVCNYGHLNMTGGTISGNMAATGNDIHVMNTMNISGKVEIGYIYLSTDKKIALEEGFVTENIIEVVMPDYEVDTQVLTGEATVLTESYSYFKVPDSSGMVITAAGTLGNSININDVAGLTLKNVLSQIMYQVQMQFCRTAGIVMNF